MQNTRNSTYLGGGIAARLEHEEAVLRVEGKIFELDHPAAALHSHPVVQPDGPVFVDDQQDVQVGRPTNTHTKHTKQEIHRFLAFIIIIIISVEI